MRLLTFILLLYFAPNALASVKPAAVGWGNLFVPGLGATLREEPTRGAIEAVLELGLFYGATIGVSEGNFTIDSTVTLQPARRGRRTLLAPTLGRSLQQIGLKTHMFNTFYHYQQATLSLSEPELEKEKLQPLYKGSWTDVLAAPFSWKNLKEPLVFGVILGAAAALTVDYRNTKITKLSYRPTPTEDGLTAFNQIGLIPLGSAFGEEPLFRGMMQREFHSYTGSVWAAVAMQTAVFAALHPEENFVPAALGGIYFGYLTHHFQGDIEQAVAAHFWVNVISGIYDFFKYKLTYGGSAPFSPGASLVLSFPL